MPDQFDRIDRQLVSIAGPGVVKTRAPSTAREQCRDRAKEFLREARVESQLSLRDLADDLELRSHKTVAETEQYGKRLEALVDLMMADPAFYARVVHKLNNWHRFERAALLKVGTDE